VVVAAPVGVNDRIVSRVAHAAGTEYMCCREGIPGTKFFDTLTNTGFVQQPSGLLRHETQTLDLLWTKMRMNPWQRCAEFIFPNWVKVNKRFFIRQEFANGADAKAMAEFLTDPRFQGAAETFDDARRIGYRSHQANFLNGRIEAASSNYAGYALGAVEVPTNHIGG